MVFLPTPRRIVHFAFTSRDNEKDSDQEACVVRNFSNQRPSKTAIMRYAMRRVLLLSFLTLSVVATSAQNAPPPVLVERLAGLGRVWGAVKFFHPFLAYKPIDWDGALVQAIPKVKAARTLEEY